jgi:hypothetical protein
MVTFSSTKPFKHNLTGWAVILTLEDEGILKVFYSMRHDSDALFAHFDIKLVTRETIAVFFDATCSSYGLSHRLWTGWCGAQSIKYILKLNHNLCHVNIMITSQNIRKRRETCVLNDMARYGTARTVREGSKP